MVGRFVGSALLTRFPAFRLLAVNAAVAALLCLFVVLTRGVPAGWAAIAIGLFNSIMFPVIFTLTLERSTASTEATSGFLCLSIIGGALVPLLVGKVADMSDYARLLHRAAAVRARRRPRPGPRRRRRRGQADAALTPRHCERSEAIQSPARDTGLLRRYAPRNDEAGRYRSARTAGVSRHLSSAARSIGGAAGGGA
jgi:hypothetical protein